MSEEQKPEITEEQKAAAELHERALYLYAAYGEATIKHKQALQVAQSYKKKIQDLEREIANLAK